MYAQLSRVEAFVDRNLMQRAQHDLHSLKDGAYLVDIHVLLSSHYLE